MSGTITAANGSTSPYYQQAIAAAEKYGVPTDLFTQQIGIESGWDAGAVNGSQEGLGQLSPAVQSQYGVTSPFDPTQNLDAAAAYDADLYKSTGDWGKAVEAYNVGLTGLENGATPSAAYQDLAASWDGTSNASNASSDSSSSDTTIGNSFLGNIFNAVPGMALTQQLLSPITGTGLAGQGDQADTTTLSGFIGNLFGEAVVIILGMIFVAAGLHMLTTGDSISQTASSAVRTAGKVGRVAAEAA